MSSLHHKLLPTFGGYPEQPWNQSTGKSLPNSHFFFTGVRNDSIIGNDLLPMQEVVQDESVPYMTCEIGPGVQVCDHRRPWITVEDALSMAIDTLGDGCNLLGFYMFHGGSNPLGRLTTMQESRESGSPNDCPVISYDFQAPIGEAGYRRESYYRLQSVFRFLHCCGSLLAPMVSVFPDRRPADLEDTETLRCCLRSDGEGGFLFINNHHHGKRLPEHKNVRFKMKFTDGQTEIVCPVIPTDVSFVMPVRMRLNERLRLEYAFALPLAVEGRDYYFEEIEGVEPRFCFDNGRELVVRETAFVEDITIHVCHRPAPEQEEGRALSFREAGKDTWIVEGVSKKAGRVRISYFGDRIAVYDREKIVGDQFYYGDFLEFYKPEGIESLRIQIKPLEPEKDVYLECERKNGAGLEAVLFFDI